jgi:hypothetical protein
MGEEGEASLEKSFTESFGSGGGRSSRSSVGHTVRREVR